MKHLTRRDMLRSMLVLGAGAASASVLASCGATATPAPAAATSAPAEATAAPQATTAPTQASAEKVNLVHSTWADPEAPWGKYCAHYIEKFQTENPNVTVEYQSVPWADYHTKLLTQIAGGAGPDTFGHSNVYYPKFISKGGAVALDDYIASAPDFDKEDFLPTSLRLSTYEGKLYGIPHISSCFVRVWNKTVFGELGLPSPNEQDAAGEWNWETFLDAATKATTRDSAGKAEKLGFGDPGINYLTSHQFLWQNGADMLKQPNLDEFMANLDAGAEAIQFQGDLINKYKVAPAAGEILTDTVSDFNTGRIAMFDSWANLSYLKFDEFEFGDLVYPAGNSTRASILHTNSMGIYSKSKYADWGWKFISMMGSKEGDLDQVNFGIGIVLRQSNLDAMTEVNRSKFKCEHPEVVSDIISTGRTFDITVMYSEIETLFNAGADQIRNGERTAKQVLDELKPKIDAELAKIGA
ncbi:MAG: ABC transporter substrate-binding protein [Anaerolineae bacterium]